ncbi:dephospho-CoA kinase [Parachitinimonas caeni]|uniref:Dephospho-CoA kinase n=1 Tax=Parachitinimonas caeni TaxID=3031301 RepID=A0ABT7DW04_9NEIS|nr:dephospho-CoA kinase [Parachitinimonas caeni]MDK2124029.1 dephospho-CoA kinase [Parachitinimonas caeni]
MKPIIGLTGGIGCGKSTVAEWFVELGAALIDTDVIAHEMSRSGSPAMQDVASVFGPEFLTGDGALDRVKMRQLVFADSEKRKQLESIFHPRIRAEVMRRIQQVSNDAPYILLAVPLLFESNAYADVVARSLVVDCSEETQIQRVMDRSSMTEAQVRAIIASQMSRSERVNRATDLIDNGRSLEHARQQVLALHDHYTRMGSR